MNTIYPMSQSRSRSSDPVRAAVSAPSNSSPWCGHHLLSYAVYEGDIERIQILTQHPYIQLDVNQLNHNKRTALTYVMYLDQIDDGNALKPKLLQQKMEGRHVQATSVYDIYTCMISMNFNDSCMMTSLIISSHLDSSCVSTYLLL